MAVTVKFYPGEQYHYGTVNYDVLGLVIEIVTRQSYEDFMREQVFQPLGLHRTNVYKEDAQATGQLGDCTPFVRQGSKHLASLSNQSSEIYRRLVI